MFGDEVRMNPWMKATTVSALVAVVFTIGTSILFGGGRSYPPAIEWERVHGMKYGDAQAYLAERAVHQSGWEAFRQGVRSPLYWQHLLRAYAASFALALVSCSGLLLWLRSHLASHSTGTR